MAAHASVVHLVIPEHPSGVGCHLFLQPWLPQREILSVGLTAQWPQLTLTSSGPGSHEGALSEVPFSAAFATRLLSACNLLALSEDMAVSRTEMFLPSQVSSLVAFRSKKMPNQLVN